MLAVRHERDDCVAVLLQAGAATGLTDVLGRTALHWAAACDVQGCVKQLTAARAPLDAGDRSGWTALHLAVREHNHAVTHPFLEAGAKPDCANVALQPPMDLACANEDETAIAILSQPSGRPLRNRPTATVDIIGVFLLEKPSNMACIGFINDHIPISHYRTG